MRSSSVGDHQPRTTFREGLVVERSPISGRGLFTTVPIDEGEVVMVWGGEPFSRAELEAGEVPSGSSWSFIDEDLLLAVPDDDLDHFVNHSCDPTLWMADSLTVVTRRSVEAGEELTGDYALWEGDSDYRLAPCRCGTGACRSEVTGDDWRIPGLQRRYADHFVPYLSRRIAAAGPGRGPETDGGRGPRGLHP